MSKQTVKIVAVLLCLVALAVLVPRANSFVILLVTRALTFAILAMSLDILLGFTGLGARGPAADI